MGENSKIAWTDHTFNPWWGCTPVSEGCKNCYAATLAKRVGQDCFGVGKERRTFTVKHWKEPRKWNVAACRSSRRDKVFCGSMCDVFEDLPELFELRNDLTSLFLATPYLDWLLLTKRIENAEQLLPWGKLGMFASPFRNVWVGTTVENAEAAHRLDTLRTVDCVLRFVSLEPLIGDVGKLNLGGIGWVIVGGESGPNRRCCDLSWVRRVVEQCATVDVPCFVKQVHVNGCLSHDPSEWPQDLRVRQFPRSKNE